jgi:hypothetical protein
VSKEIYQRYKFKFSQINFFKQKVMKTYSAQLSSKEIQIKLTKEEHSKMIESLQEFIEIKKELSNSVETNDVNYTVKDQSINNDYTSTEESFPWLYDSEGNPINFNENINLFDGVSLISNFLEKKYKFATGEISDIKFTEILKPFEGRNSITIMELYNHVSNLHKQGYFKEALIQEIGNENSTINENLNKFEESKPLGQIGEITINQLVTKLKDLNWENINWGVKTTVHAAPVALNVISYGLVLKTYLKVVHNRPTPEGLNITELKKLNISKHNRLLLFSTIWAPLIVVGIRTFSPSFIKNAVDVELLPSSSSGNQSVDTNKTGLILILSKIREAYIKNIPEYLRIQIKWLFRILAAILIILNLVGFRGVWSILSNTYYLKLYFLIGSSLAICYELLNLYLLYRFIKKNMIISSVLPDYLINMLKEIENISQDIESIKYFKKSCYTHILLYLFAIIITSLIF